MLTSDPILKEQQDKVFNPISLFLCWFMTLRSTASEIDKRICIKCNFKGLTHWRRNKNKKWLCSKCYQHDYMKKYHKTIFSFKGKLLTAKKNIRKGICSWCNNIIDGINTKRTSLHHKKYDAKNPLKYTVEICNRCHKKLYKRKPEIVRFCFDCGLKNTRIELTPHKGLSEHWYFLDLASNKFLCNKCYCKRKRRGLLANK